MKNIKYLILVLLQFSAFSMIGQGLLDNGRDSQVAPNEPQEQKEEVVKVEQLKNGSDADIPGDYTGNNVASDDWFFPEDLSILGEELNAGASSAAVIQQINGLTAQIEALVLSNEQLREENRLIRKSLSACCDSGDLGLSASDAYLLQNAPNPFSEYSEIKYFVPQKFINAQLEIRNMNGTVIKEYPLTVRGYGKVNIADQIMESGTYIYYLVIDGSVVDSKVMILTK